MSRTTRAQRQTASNALIWPVVDLLRQLDSDLDSTLADIGLDQVAVYDPNGRTTLHQHHVLWNRAVEITGDSALGVRLASLAEPKANVSWPPPLSFFEHIGLVSDSLSHAIAMQSRFARIMRDGISPEVEIDDTTATFRMESPVEDPPALVEHNFAVLLNLARRVARRDLTPTEVWFAHAPPRDTEPHARLFRAPIRWHAPFDALIGPAEDYTRRLDTRDPVLCARIAEQAERMLGALPNFEQFEERVRAQIRAELPDGNTSATAVAEKLGVSCRTLHRRLQREGARFQDVLDEVRFREAARHLGAGKSIGTVAELVGFAQSSTFHRAFKSWAGETPAEYLGRERAALTN